VILNDKLFCFSKLQTNKKALLNFEQCYKVNSSNSMELE